MGADKKGVLYFYDEKTDEEEKIEHQNAEDLNPGFYIVEDFKEIKKPSMKLVRKHLDEGQNVYKASCYGGSGPSDELFFTGKVVWRCNDPYETSSFAGSAINLGKVPAGTLVVAVDDD